MRGGQRRGKPESNPPHTPHETPSSLHHHQQKKRHTLRRSHLKPDPKNLSAQTQTDQRIRREVRL